MLRKRWKISGKHVYEIIIHKSFSQGTQATIFFRSKNEYKISSIWLGMLYAHIFMYILSKRTHLTLGNAMEAHHWNKYIYEREKRYRITYAVLYSRILCIKISSHMCHLKSFLTFAQKPKHKNYFRLCFVDNVC